MRSLIVVKENNLMDKYCDTLDQLRHKDRLIWKVCHKNFHPQIVGLNIFNIFIHVKCYSVNKKSYKYLSMLMLPFHNKFIFSFIILNMLLRLCVYYNNNSNERIQNPVIRDDNLIRKYPFMCNLWMKKRCNNHNGTTFSLQTFFVYPHFACQKGLLCEIEMD